VSRFPVLVVVKITLASAPGKYLVDSVSLMKLPVIFL
jgi:hypothetical protein